MFAFALPDDAGERRGIRLVTISSSKEQGYPALTGDHQVNDELLQVGTLIPGVAMSDPDRYWLFKFPVVLFGNVCAVHMEAA